MNQTSFRRLGCTFALLCLLARPAAAVPPAASAPLETRVTEVSAAFCAHPANLETLFSAKFLNSVPPAKLEALLQDMHAKLGPVTVTKLLSHPSPERGTFLLTFQHGYEAKLDLVVAPQPPHRIVGMWIGAPSPVAGDLQGLMAEFKKLPGKASFSACRLDDTGAHPVAELNPDTPLALGSGFKLFVLGALIEDVASGKRRWTETLPLKRSLKSMPSGILQDWPDGAPLTLHSLASLMISMSDNTATDHLLMALGREHIERVMGRMGVARPELNRPFLTTREMFLLKGRDKGSALPVYLAKDAAARRVYLRDVVARQDLQEASGFDGEHPVAIDQVEWFASSHDMVLAMDWIRRHTAAGTVTPGREILAINSGISLDKESWSYVGYKGGSEPGVLSMTLLLQSRIGSWYAMSACWSDASAEVDTGRMVGLMQKAGALLASEGR